MGLKKNLKMEKKGIPGDAKGAPAREHEKKGNQSRCPEIEGRIVLRKTRTKREKEGYRKQKFHRWHVKYKGEKRWRRKDCTNTP